MVENSSKCVFLLIPMLGRVKNSHYSSHFQITNGAKQERSKHTARVGFPNIFEPLLTVVVEKVE